MQLESLTWELALDLAIVPFALAALAVGIHSIVTRPDKPTIKPNRHGWSPGPTEMGIFLATAGLAVLLASMPTIIGIPEAWPRGTWRVKGAVFVALVVVIASWFVRGGGPKP